MKTHPFLGILFDLDGTLLDTAPDFEFCLNLLLEEENKPKVSSKALRVAVNHGLKGILTSGFGPLSSPAYKDLENRLSQYYAEHMGKYCVLFPGIEAGLALLNSHNMAWGIVTNKLEKFTLPLVKNISAFDKAQVIVSGDTLAFSKPHPAPLQYACEKMNLNPASTLYVGDAERDMQAAIAAGMPCVAATYGYLSKSDNPTTWGANYLIDNSESLFKVIMG